MCDCFDYMYVPAEVKRVNQTPLEPELQVTGSCHAPMGIVN